MARYPQKFLVVILFAVCSKAAMACSCEPPLDTVPNAEFASAAFTARVLSIRVVKHNNSWLQRTRRRLFEKDPPYDGYLFDELEIEYKPLEIFKGTTLGERRLTTRESESMCGYPSFEVGKEFLVFAWRTEAQVPSTNLCSGTKPLSEVTNAVEALRRRFATTSAR